jgi:cytosine/uracil/thiamine/allantoin permease
MLSGGLMVAAGLSFQAALATGFFGTIVALVFYLIMATLGVDYGIPGQVATRVVYGLRGSKLIPSLLRTLVASPSRPLQETTRDSTSLVFAGLMP